MTDSVLIAGATETMGGSVVDALLATRAEFDVRGLTRRPNSDATVALRHRGVSIVQGDMTVREAMDRSWRVASVRARSGGRVHDGTTRPRQSNH
ncbi:NmrA family NAD(P)-binding protein [Halovenus amylolytica]|uniref:NmrA family NAD(P)-binding protein n=1 Tax=Halovenus amylolytica TaxID=2500550 RepID=UPI003D6A17C6